MVNSKDIIEETEKYGAHNYGPLEVVLADGEGCWVKDLEGRSYLDMLSAYSALNFGHKNKRIQAAAERQLQKITLTSRAFYNEQFGAFCRELAQLCGMEMVLAMNSGAEAVETAIKIARRWAYAIKQVPPDKAEIICMDNNFAGRTVTILSFSTVLEYRENFGPFTGGFNIVPFGNIKALCEAINPNTAAVLLEPIQGEGGVIIPPDGYLKQVRDVCNKQNVLMIADEIQTGLCRTGNLFACDYESVKPDLYLLAKSLGGGITPISAVVGRESLLGLFNPGSHGSTMGGNPFACAIAREVIALIIDEQPHLRAKVVGERFKQALVALNSKYVSEVRGRGLMIGVDIKPEFGSAKMFCKKLMYEGILCKDTRAQTIRFAPPLVISDKDIDWALEKIAKVLT